MRVISTCREPMCHFVGLYHVLYNVYTPGSVAVAFQSFFMISLPYQSRNLLLSNLNIFHNFDQVSYDVGWYWCSIFRKGVVSRWKQDNNLNRSFCQDMKKYIEYTRQCEKRSIGKGVLFKTIDVKVQVHFVPELWRQMFWKVLLFLWNVTYYKYLQINK